MFLDVDSSESEGEKCEKDPDWSQLEELVSESDDDNDDDDDDEDDESQKEGNVQRRKTRNFIQ